MMKRIFTFLFFVACICNLLEAQTFEGYALYNNSGEKTTYLIDAGGDVVHEWNCETGGVYAAYLRTNGNMFRTAKYSDNKIKAAAASGKVEEYNWDGDLLWEFVYSTDKILAHHDIAPGPNGTIFIIALEVKTNTEATQAGRSDAPSKFWNEQILQVGPDGNGGGKIIWKWSVWDHLVQDADQSKDNYGVVKDHPELMDVNLGKVSSGDWIHMNGIDYNPDLDQIAYSSRLMSEIFVIDHSTTTDEAASHEGGKSGKGGDFLYRWGNPSNYGASGKKIITQAVHDAHWNALNTPKPGYLVCFNNQGGTGEGSVVDMMETPFNGKDYDIEKGQAFAPSDKSTWRHEALKETWGQSSSQLLPNGNLFVCINSGYLYEVDKDGEKIWDFSTGKSCPKAFRYAEDFVTAIQKVHGEKIDFKVYPNPSNGTFHIAGDFFGNNKFEISVFDLTGKKIKYLQNQVNFNLSEYDNGFYFLQIMKDGMVTTKKISLQK